MGRFITFGPENKPLEFFSTPHITAIIVIAVICLFMVVFKNIFKNKCFKQWFRYVTAIFILLQQALLYVWYIAAGEWSVSWTLPIQLCDIAVLLSIFALLRTHLYINELLYFWGLGGATQAILTPDIGNFSFPHFVFYQFFIGHGLILLTCIYLIVVDKFRPTIKSVLRVFILTNIYTAIIIPVNYITGGNYLFLRYKPQGGSLLSLLGPWPWYILELEAVALVLFVILYLPFAFTSGRKELPAQFLNQ